MLRQGARVDAALNLADQLFFHFPGEREPLVRLADSGNGSVHKHELEVLRLLAAELVEPPENTFDALERLEVPERLVEALGVVAGVQQAEAFLRERVEDVVLAGKVPVDGGGAVFDLLGDLPDGDVPVAFADEQLARGVENRTLYRLAIALLP